jgi:ATP-dependent exoDNAse (exonuclease V) beta subunit
MTSGVVDLAFRRDSKWMIVDYKTDTVDASEALATKYADQLQAYKRAWGLITGEEAESQVLAVR